MLSKGEAAALLSLINAHHGNAQWMMFSLTLLFGTAFGYHGGRGA